MSIETEIALPTETLAETEIALPTEAPAKTRRVNPLKQLEPTELYKRALASAEQSKTLKEFLESMGPGASESVYLQIIGKHCGELGVLLPRFAKKPRTTVARVNKKLGLALVVHYKGRLEQGYATLKLQGGAATSSLLGIQPGEQYRFSRTPEGNLLGVLEPVSE